MIAGAKMDAASARAFVTAGHARFTLVSQKTGARYTFEVQASKREDDARSFVKVLTGSDNESDYTYLGTVFDGVTYRHGARSSIGPDAPSARAFGWAWPRIVAGLDLTNCEIWHEGRCGRCGRALTVPESIASGLGPICMEKAA